MKNLYESIFGESPATQTARQERDAAFQDMLNARRQSAKQQQTSDKRMATYNALGNVLTTMVQPLGWGIGGRTGNTQPYDDRQYISAFNRAVKAGDDLRNIGTAEGEYKFKLADENFKRAQKMDDEARERAFKEEDLERKYQQKAEEQQRKFDNDMAKQERQYELKMQIAEFNAAHRITNRSTGQNADWREKSKLLQGYISYANEKAKYNEEPMTYPEWLEWSGFSQRETGTGNGGNNGDGGIDIGIS